jgi:hypothetical protein
MEPLAVFLRLEPTYGNYRLVRIVEAGLSPIGRRRVPSGFEKKGKVAIAHLVDRHVECTHPDLMDGTLLIAALFTTHQEFSRGNHCDGRFDYSLYCLIAEGGMGIIG